MRVLVIGGSGFIGLRVLGCLSGKHATFGTFYRNVDIRLLETPFCQLDVRNRDAVHEVVVGLRPEVVVLVCGSQCIEVCAGTEGREEEAKEAWSVHVDGTRNAVEACRKCASRIVYVSTDCVFDGLKPFFCETDEPNPFNAYGRMKRRGEEIVEASRLDYALIRVSLTFGWRRHTRQFRNFALRVLDGLDQPDSTVCAAMNLLNTPIEVSCAARAIARIAVARDQGVFHVASPDRVSRFEFARSLAVAFGFDRSRVRACEDCTGLRQPNSCLSTAQTEATLGTQFEGLHEGILRMKREWAAPT